MYQLPFYDSLSCVKRLSWVAYFYVLFSTCTRIFGFTRSLVRMQILFMFSCFFFESLCLLSLFFFPFSFLPVLMEVLNCSNLQIHRSIGKDWELGVSTEIERYCRGFRWNYGSSGWPWSWNPTWTDSFCARRNN